jgi:regulator of protease activity HflC (stomatin/prohibitin superfamily)
MKELLLTIIAGLSVIALLAWGVPQWNVYRARMSGKAAIQRAEESKQIIIEDAKARLEAAKLDAQAEVERAKGMSEAMKIEGGQLTAVYNQYLFIRTLEELSEQGNLPQIIYVPSDGMVPVMDLKVPSTELQTSN